MTPEEILADVLAKHYEKSAGDAEAAKGTKGQRPLHELPEVLSVLGKRNIDYGLATGLLSGILGGTGSLLYGNKPLRALKHGLMGGGLGALVGGSLPTLWSKFPFTEAPGAIPGLSEHLWEHPSYSTYYDPVTNAFVDGPDYRAELSGIKTDPNYKEK